MVYPLARPWNRTRRGGGVCKSLETFNELIGVYLRQIDLRLRRERSANFFRRAEEAGLSRSADLIFLNEKQEGKKYVRT